MFILYFIVGSVALFGLSKLFGKKVTRNKLIKLGENKDWEKFNDSILRYARNYVLDKELRWLNFIAKSETCGVQEIKEAAQDNLSANFDNIELLKVDGSEYLGFVWAHDAQNLEKLVNMAKESFQIREEKAITQVDLKILEESQKGKVFASYIVSKVQKEDCNINSLIENEKYLGFFVVFNDLYEEHLS